MSFIKRKSGQGLVEYALIIGLVTLVALAALTLFSDALVSSYFETIPAAISEALPWANG